ncbi:cbb3-type cytochrome oxidase assembly protein CcoS [Paracoccus aestuarii]|uniref:Cbb3-type cytochrome oxidase assembly protein CcoS n=1 Tax=Paracoccus aestuarii TaxID=453842 RepID=A0A419A1D9_9RHOB|nr:cbb3-type cytochrome oxidase assembly protein CcoS [Paracoccus aestuarii]RJL06762.1 cbb3-type cytochrome oxidase assembly protein CcoS [Paracoccus aestuarii]WCQ97985.1 cbb3-type cytochrome oxidase assembly protein CcoS [Paracoccus aestuarii]
MDILAILIPVSLGLGAVGLGAFLWALRHRQFDDPNGDGQRVLSDRWDDRPPPD